MDTSLSSDSPAVELARGHLEASTNHVCEVRTEGGPLGSRLFPSAQTWVLDKSGKIKVERIVSTAIPLRLV